MNQYPRKQVADELASYGRYGDELLLHVNRAELEGIASLSPTGKLTTNPVTGQPEAFLPLLLPMLASWGGSAAAGAGLLGAGMATTIGTAIAGGIGSGLATAVITGDIKRGIASGIMGAGIGSALGAAGAAATDVASTVVPEGIEAIAEQAVTGVGTTLGEVAAQEAATQAATSGAVNVSSSIQPPFMAPVTSPLPNPNFMTGTPPPPSFGEALKAPFQEGSGFAAKMMKPTAMIPTIVGMGQLSELTDQERWDKEAEGLLGDREAKKRESYDDLQRAYRAAQPDAPTGLSPYRSQMSRRLPPPMYGYSGGITHLKGGGVTRMQEGGQTEGLGMMANKGLLVTTGLLGTPFPEEGSEPVIRGQHSPYGGRWDIFVGVGQAYPNEPYIINGDGTFTIKRTGEIGGLNLAAGQKDYSYYNSQPDGYGGWMSDDAKQIDPSVGPFPSMQSDYTGAYTGVPTKKGKTTTMGVGDNGPPKDQNGGGGYPGYLPGFGGAGLPGYSGIDPITIQQGLRGEFPVAPPPNYMSGFNPEFSYFQDDPANIQMPPTRTMAQMTSDLYPQLAPMTQNTPYFSSIIPGAPQPVPPPPPDEEQPIGRPNPWPWGGRNPRGSLPADAYYHEDPYYKFQPKIDPPPPGYPPPGYSPPTNGDPTDPYVPPYDKFPPRIDPPWLPPNGSITYPFDPTGPVVGPLPPVDPGVPWVPPIKLPPQMPMAHGGITLNSSLGNVNIAEGGIANLESEFTQQPTEADIQLLASALLGQTQQTDQIVEMFVKKYGPEVFKAVRQMILQSGMPNAQTEGMIRGAGGGMDDQVPGMIGAEQPVAVSPGEYIVPADVVSGLGDGSSDAGAIELDSMGDRVRMARGGSSTQPPPTNARRLMPR